MLSMDGAKETQSYNRNENSFEQLDTIIPYLLKKLPNTNFRGTIIPATCQYTFENILYAFNKGFNSSYFTINIFEKWDNELAAIQAVSDLVNNFSLIKVPAVKDQVENTIIAKAILVSFLTSIGISL
jgi:hypothetical protein